MDLRFVSGKQWDDSVANERKQAERPVMTFNRLHTFVQQVANEARNARPQIKFSPLDAFEADAANPETAEAMEGHARAIQRKSKADVAYDTAITYSASGSFGYFGLTTDYLDDKTNRVELKFRTINDPFSIYGILMPKLLGQKPRWAFEVYTMSREEFKEEYPKSECVSFEWADDIVRPAGDWISDSSVRVARYWTVESTTEIVEVQGRKRRQKVDKVYCCVLNGAEILEEKTEWVGRCIPIFAVLGWSMIADGKPQLMSVVRFHRDPQKMLNACFTSMGERLGLGNRAPYVGYEGQFKDPKWQNANKVNYPYLEAKAITVNGTLAPLPQRQNVAVEVHDLAQVAMLMIDDMKASAGIFDASLGKETTANQSGVAQRELKAQSSITNYHFIDNLNRAQEECGDEMAYIIPRIHDTAQTVQVTKADETTDMIRINERYVDPKTGNERYIPYQDKNGEPLRFNVSVDIAPGYGTARKEAFANMSQWVSANPQLMATSGDQIFNLSDIPGKDAIVERENRRIKLQFPGLIEDENSKQDPEQLKQMLQAMGQQHDALVQQVQTLTTEIQTNAYQVQSNERIKLADIEVKKEQMVLDAQVELAKLGQADTVAKLKIELDAIRAQMDSAFRDKQHAAGEAARQDEMGHDVAMKGMDRQHQSDMQATDQSHQVGMAEMQGQQAEKMAQMQAESTGESE
jgi:hypothetical protein